MSPKRDRPLSIDQAARQLADAKIAYDRAVERESLASRIAATEPRSTGRVVRFSHRYGQDNKVYTYAAIRCDNFRGARRWFLTSNDGIAQGGHRGIASPATWVELVEFAIPGTVCVAPLAAHWHPVPVPATAGSNLPASRASSTVDAPFDQAVESAFFGPDSRAGDIGDQHSDEYPHSPGY